MKKLSDNEQRPRKLEEIFRDGMNEAEMTPSDRLWERIEQNLDVKEAGFYKKRMAWYQMVAAACITLVVFAGVYLYYDLQQGHHPANLAQQQIPAAPAPASQTTDNKVNNASGQQDVAAAGQLANINQQPATVNAEVIRQQIPQSVKPQNLPVTIASDALAIAQHKAISGTRKQQHNFSGETAAESGLVQEEVDVSAGAIATNTIKSENVQEVTDSENNILHPIHTLALLNGKSGFRDSIQVKYLPEIPAVATPAYVASTNKKPGSLSRWSIGGKYASHYFDQNISLAPDVVKGYQPTALAAAPFNNATPSSYSQAMSEFDKRTTPEYSFNTAIAAAYQVNEHWAVETGVDYTQNVASTNSSYIFRSQASNARFTGNFSSSADNSSFLVENITLPTSAFVASLSPESNAGNTQIIRTPAFDTQYRYRLVGIPVKVNYQTSEKKSFYFASVGFLANLLVQANILSDSPRVPDIEFTRDSESPFRNVQMAASASVGRGFRVGKSINLRAGLEATQYLTTLAANPELLEGKHQRPYTIGVAVSSSYNLAR